MSLSQTRHKQRDAYYKRTYGITLVQYNVILKKQGGVCAVCKRPPKPERNLAVDHDHKTGEIFGLLCYVCNHRLIGRIRNASLFTCAGIYLLNGLGLFVSPKKKKRRKRRK